MKNIILNAKYKNLNGIGREDIIIKLECEQFGNSFKSRGIYNFLKHTKNVRGLVTFTTGNHGIALAAIANELGIKAVILSTNQLSSYKREIIEDYGAVVHLIDSFSLEYATKYAKRFAIQNNYTFVPLFDDEYLLEGYSKITEEIFNDLKGNLIMFFPIGSGSLLYANARLAKSLDRDCKIIGVEPQIYQRMTGLQIQNAPSKSIAESLSIDRIPASNLELVKYIDGVETLEEYEIANAASLIFEQFNLMIEPGGSIALAAAMKTEKSEEKKIAVVTGKNLSIEKYNSIIRQFATNDSNNIKR